MSTEQNKALMQRFYDEAFGLGRLEAIDQLIAPTFVDHTPENPTHDRAGLERFVAHVRSAFPDVTVKTEDLIADGDLVVARVTVSGTHRGEFLGIPPTGRPISFGCIDIVRCVGGQAVEHWSEADTLGLLQQLGALQSPIPA